MTEFKCPECLEWVPAKEWVWGHDCDVQEVKEKR